MSVDPQGRIEPPLTGGELETLLGFLDYQRATLDWKTRGLDAAGLAASIHPTTMTLGGLLKHMAYVEDFWMRYRFAGEEPHPIWAQADWDADPDWEWHSAAQDTPEQLRTLWLEAVEQSGEVLARALDTGQGLDQQAARARRDGTAPNLRWILLHLLEEYARHNGHADLLREAVDGEVGE